VGQKLEVEYSFARAGLKQKVLFTEGGIAKISAFFENSDTSSLLRGTLYWVKNCIILVNF
jgi:hypothetical protein